MEPDPRSFDHLAEGYDLMVELEERPDFFLQRLPARRRSALDVGCGSGILTLALSNHFERVWGLDKSEAMIELARERRSAENVAYARGDVEVTPLDRRFDLIVSHTTFHHLEDPKTVLRRLAGHLEPGGRLVVVDCISKWPLLRRCAPLFRAHMRTYAFARFPADAWRHGISTARRVHGFRSSDAWLGHLCADRLLTARGFRRTFEDLLPGASFTRSGPFMTIDWSAPEVHPCTGARAVMTRRSASPTARLGLLAAGLLAAACGASDPGGGPRPSSTSGPGPRWGHSLVWDALREEVLLFGGMRQRGGPFLNDTWTWNGEAWRRHDVEAPPGRGMAAAAFHPTRGTVVLHGGRAGGRDSHSDTWEWNGSAWAVIEDGGPVAVDHHAMVYVPASDELLLFGGWNGTDVSGETWLFDGAWRRHEGSGPPPRSAFGMTYDAGRDAVVLCGGLWIEGQYADVWEWTQEGWRAVSGRTTTPPSTTTRSSGDPARAQVVGFGGKNYRYQPLDRVFTIEEGRTVELATGGPDGRHTSPLAWDGSRVILYGGKRYEGRELVPIGDLWAWDGTGWDRLDD